MAETDMNATLTLSWPKMPIERDGPHLKLTARENGVATLNVDGIDHVCPCVIPPTVVRENGSSLHWLVDACVGLGNIDGNSCKVSIPQEPCEWLVEYRTVCAMPVPYSCDFVLKDGRSFTGILTPAPCPIHLLPLMYADPLTMSGKMTEANSHTHPHHKPPLPPRHVRLFLTRHPYRRSVMNDATLAWKASPSANVTGYQITWMYNGTAQPPQTVARTSALDSSGYTLDFATANPSITVQPGDTIDATIIALDATDNLQSTPVTPPAVTEPVQAPASPQNVTLVLS